MRLTVVALFVLGLTTAQAAAHMMPAQQGTLNVLDNAVYAVLSLPVGSLRAVDDDGDGRLSSSEIARHYGEIRDAVTRGIRVSDGGRFGRIDFLQVAADPDERDSGSSAGSTHFLVLAKFGFDRAPVALRLETTMWGTTAEDRQFTIKATRGATTEAAVLTDVRNVHAFFQAPWQVLSDFVSVGIAHILGGPDHLLFLLTVIVAAVGWRSWAGVVTSFTIAHCITLTLSQLEIVQVSPAIVEPLIAASIMVMAVLNLRNSTAATTHRIWLVFACGLLHGFGFASSMASMGVRGGNQVASVVGFNLGIELGQALFIAVVVGLCYSLRVVLRCAGWDARGPWVPRTLVSGLAGLVGMIWFVERL
jgi:hydrogenase/urease accessory protein HupE